MRQANYVAAIALLVAVGAPVFVASCSKDNSRASSAVPPGSAADSGSASAAPSASGPGMAFDDQPDPRFTAGVPLRPMDHDIFALLSGSKPIERTRMTDVWPDKPYRVQLIGSPAEQHFSGLLVDLTRDGSIDERWAFKPGAVERVVQSDPNNGGTPVLYTLGHGRWQVH